MTRGFYKAKELVKELVGICEYPCWERLKDERDIYSLINHKGKKTRKKDLDRRWVEEFFRIFKVRPTGLTGDEFKKVKSILKTSEFSHCQIT